MIQQEQQYFEKVLLNLYRAGASSLFDASAEVSAAFAADLAAKLLSKRCLSKYLRNRAVPDGFPLNFFTASNHSTAAGAVKLYGLRNLAVTHPNLFSVKVLPEDELPNECIYLWTLFNQVFSFWRGNVGFCYRDFDDKSRSLYEVSAGECTNEQSVLRDAGESVEKPEVLLPSIDIYNYPQLDLS